MTKTPAHLSLLLLLISGPLARADEPNGPAELPQVNFQYLPGQEFSLAWDTVAGQTYRVERSSSLLDTEWSVVKPDTESDGTPMSFSEALAAEPAAAPMFYRVGVSPDPFVPASLAPTWQLDAQSDFPGTADGTVISQWTGTGIASSVQASTADRPVYSGGSVVFDGNGDFLALPMWAGGVSSQWTYATLIKLRQGVLPSHALFGGDAAANRVIQMAYRDGGLSGYIPGYATLVAPENCAFTPNDNWRVLIIRSDGTQLKIKLDWYEGTKDGATQTIGHSGNFNLGAGHSPPLNSAPVSIRYAAFFPTCISDQDSTRMARWLERKKGGEYPPVTLLYGGGQSNYLGSLFTLQRDLPGALGNVAFSFGSYYGGRPLNLWMKDKDDGSGGYEVCPQYDLSAAPPGTAAYYIGTAHSGTKVISDWNIRAATVAKHPRIRNVCIFVQGETDTDDARTQWKPNGNGEYNLHQATPYELADSYGPRSLAWNAATRSGTGHPDMTFIYERVHYYPSALNALQVEGGHRQRKSQLDALAQDPRYFLVDTDEYSRFDGVHFSTPQYQASESPNCGSERFTRATARLIQASDDLAALGYDARMLAMRAIDSGFTLDAAGYAACETLAATPGFASLRSLVIPTLTTANPLEQDRLRRCNLLLHLGDKYSEGFTATVPAQATATCLPGADQETLSTALSALLTAWGLPDTVSLSELAP